MTNQLTGFSSMATRRALHDLASLYEQQTGIRTAIRSVGGVEAARLVRAGERTDIVVLAANVMDKLEREGCLVAGSLAAFAHSGMAMAIRAGVASPSIQHEEDVKEAVLRASSICYSTGPSGDHLLQLIERWGIAGVVSQRLVQAPPGVPVGILVARGEAELGFQQRSELLDVEGIEIVGDLPKEIQAVTVFTAGLSVTTSRLEDARALVEFLTSDRARGVKRRCGLHAP